MLAVTVIRDNVIDSITLFPETDEGRAKAESAFLLTCNDVLSNFDEYTQDDIEAILDNGYETFGNGSVCLSVTENYNE